MDPNIEWQFRHGTEPQESSAQNLGQLRLGRMVDSPVLCWSVKKGQKCSTGQRFIFTEVTFYKIPILKVLLKILLEIVLMLFSWVKRLGFIPIVPQIQRRNWNGSSFVSSLTSAKISITSKSLTCTAMQLAGNCQVLLGFLRSLISMCRSHEKQGGYVDSLWLRKNHYIQKMRGHR